jgi:uncharacterized membrane protein YdcZ (DUF606 family)
MVVPGCIGGVVVASTVLLIAELGFSLFFVVAVSSSMVTSVLLDYVALRVFSRWHVRCVRGVCALGVGSGWGQGGVGVGWWGGGG